MTWNDLVVATTGTPRLRQAVRRAQLLDVTLELIVERGFHGVSVEAVAQRAGVTRAVVYRHFQDLRALFAAVIERETIRAQAQVDAAAVDLDADAPLDALMAGLASYLEAVQGAPRTWRLVLMPPEGAPPSLHQQIASGRRRVLLRLADSVRPVIASEGGPHGSDPPDVALTARMLSILADEYARLVLIDPVRYPPARLVAHARWFIRNLLVMPPEPAAGAPRRS